MSYAITVKESARKELHRLPLKIVAQIDRRILGLAENPRPHGCKKLMGGYGWRIRHGDYRIVYDIDDTDETVTIARIGDRKEIYR